MGEKKRICVVGGCQGAGATFLATSLAFSLGERFNGVVYIEEPQSNRYRRSPLIINELSLEHLKNRDSKLFENVNWIIHKDWDCLDGENKAFADIGKYIIYDNPRDYRGFDLIVCVVDSLPSKVEASKKRVKHIKEYFSTKTIWVLNREFKQRTKEIERFLGINFDYTIPMEKQENFYTAEFWGRPLQRTKLISEETKTAIKAISLYVEILF